MALVADPSVGAEALGGTLRLTDPQGTLVVAAGSGATAEEALAGDHVEQRYDYRVVGGTIELLTPPQDYRAERLRRRFRLHRVDALAELTTSLRAAA